MRLADRKTGLEALLMAYAGLWRPQPFKEETPAWCEEHPPLAAEALAVPETVLEARAADTPELIRWLARHLPELAALGPLTTLPTAPRYDLPPVKPQILTHVPGRKQAQIETFAAASPPPGSARC